VKLHDDKARLGTFENLQQHVGVGYNKLKKENMLKDVENKGIFHLDDKTNKRIEALNFQRKSRLLCFLQCIKQWYFFRFPHQLVGLALRTHTLHADCFQLMCLSFCS